MNLDDLLNRAQTAFRERKFQQAQQLLERAVEASPQDPMLCLRLGQVHMAQGNVEETLSFLRQ